MSLGFETETLEFKKSTGELKEGIISIASMLNKHSFGVLYFGVKNDGTPIGQEIGDSTLRDISQAIAVFIKPQVIPTITLQLIEGKNIIKVEAKGNEIPYSAYGKYYIRSADEDRELTPGQLRGLMQKKENADEILSIRSSRQDLTFTQIKTLFAAKGLSILDDTFEKNMSFLTPTGEYNLMAELLSDKNDISIKVVVFRGKDKTEIIKRTEYGFKCLALAMDNVLSYLEALNDTSVKLNSHQREEEDRFDFACFKEAWQNACIHNKWTTGNPPAVYVYSDRIEVISTGGLPVDMNKDEFFKGISKPVNAKLQKIFGQLGYVEQTGHGVPLIIGRYGINAFDIMDNFINVTIPFSKERREIISAPEKLNDAQSKIYMLLSEKPYVTIREIRETLSMSDSYVRKVLAFLKENGYVKRIGSDRKGFWEII